MLRAVAKNLNLLLEYNVYRPTMQSSEERDFLDSIGNAIVSAMMPQRQRGISILELTAPETGVAFEILKALFLLDHTIFHDQIVNILTWCVTSDANVSEPGFPR